MKIQIRQRDRRALVMLSLALLVYGLAEIVVFPAYDRMKAASEAAVDKENQVRRYRRAELRQGQYADLLKSAAENASKSESVVIAAASLPLASAELQSLIEAAGNKVGLMVSQRMIGAPRRLNDFYAELPMTLSFESTPGQLVSFLVELRLLPRFVTVRSLQVTPTEPLFEAPKGTDVTKHVRITMTVSSLSSITLVKPESATK
ncbi:MAG: type 4a pilus biogenesis protein PilO [Acidobacteria bacterium]|nr:type 4a pilus biogenesis protein PilO [Acidobacteriota bacterium]